MGKRWHLDLIERPPRSDRERWQAFRQAAKDFYEAAFALRASGATLAAFEGGEGGALPPSRRKGEPDDG